jgi:tRNA(fMet)-specific endonuclease VapC
VDGYLLDTCVVSSLLDARHKNYENVRRADESIETGAPRFVSRITIAELMFGLAVYEAEEGTSHTRAAAVLKRAQQEYPIREITKHTATEYAELRKNLAVTFLDLQKDRARWVDQWIEKATGEKLQVDENDLWICAQARQYNLVLMTTDEKMVQRVSAADPGIKFLFVRSL